MHNLLLLQVSCHIAWGLLFLAVLHSARGEYRYKIRGPPPPPSKPMPPRPPISQFNIKPFPQGNFFNTKTKFPLNLSQSTGHRVIPPMRLPSHFQFQQQPQLHQHYLWNGPHHNLPHMPLNLHNPRPQFQFKGPNLLLPTTKLPTSWKLEGGLGHGFKAPLLKQPFLPSPPSEFSYQPPKLSLSLPQPPVVSAISNTIDDDKGPIHTIPAPNLSPSGNTNLNHHILQHEVPFSTPVAASFPHTQVTIQKSHGYEVREPSNDQTGHTPEGVATYYAPDPDPSLPAPKIPATTDPHSHPSNGKIPADLLQPQSHSGFQILDSNGGVSNTLSSQELFQLLHSPQQQQQQPQQPLVDSYGVPLIQQPQLQQHLQQQAALFPPSNFLKHDGKESSDVLKTIRDEFSPDYQTFNYEEQYQGSARQPESYVSYEQQEGSENIPSVTVVRKSPESTITSFQDQDYEQKANSVTDDEAYYDNAATNADAENQEDYEEEANDVNQNEPRPPTSYYQQINDGNGALASSYYTTLPNREAAETLATLAAAGNINSNLANHLRNKDEENTTPTKDEQQETEEEEEYEEEEEEEEQQPEVTPAPVPPQISKPITYQRPKEPPSRGSTRYPNGGVRHHYQRRPTPPPPSKQEEEDYETDQDPQGSRPGHVSVGKTEPNEEKKEERNEESKQTNPNTNVQFGTRIRPKRNK
ncbi:hypothetical protein C0J52_09346 [Blattella germanica]|nr:hypothetical protein C0J52_09346 [Blattella germanica]